MFQNCSIPIQLISWSHLTHAEPIAPPSPPSPQVSPYRLMPTSPIVIVIPTSSSSSYVYNYSTTSTSFYFSRQSPFSASSTGRARQAIYSGRFLVFFHVRIGSDKACSGDACKRSKTVKETIETIHRILAWSIPFPPNLSRARQLTSAPAGPWRCA